MDRTGMGWDTELITGMGQLLGWTVSLLSWASVGRVMLSGECGIVWTTCCT